jgi:hypothetical protein
MRRRPVDRAAEDLVEQLLDRLDGEPGDLDPLHVIGAPEGHDRVGRTM